MTGFVTLVSSEQPDDSPVALRHGGPIPFGRFRADVARTAAKLANCRSAGLFCQDSYVFAVGLFGLLHAGADIHLPQNGQPGTLKDLAGQVDRILGDDLLDAPAGDLARVRLAAIPSPDRPNIHFFTSGSTGAPKRISKSLVMLEREVATYARLWAAGPVIATVSHQHLYGLTFRLLWPLFTGQPFGAETHDVWESVLAVVTADTILVSSPAHLTRLGGLDPLASGRQPARIFTAGAPLPGPAAAECAAILGRRPTEIFGSTETGAFATRCQEKGDEAWALFPGTEIRTDADGCLQLQSSYGQGWHGTADRVQETEGGFRFLGRADRVVKIEGKRVDLHDVERALAALPMVQSAAVVVLPGSSPRLAAVVVPTPPGWRSLREMGNFRFGQSLRGALADTQEPAALPRLWRFAESLPERGMGKRKEADIVAMFDGAC